MTDRKRCDTAMIRNVTTNYKYGYRYVLSPCIARLSTARPNLLCRKRIARAAQTSVSTAFKSASIYKFQSDLMDECLNREQTRNHQKEERQKSKAETSMHFSESTLDFGMKRCVAKGTKAEKKVEFYWTFWLVKDAPKG